MTDTAVILKKPRQPVAIHTPESHEEAGRHALAQELRAHKVKRELEYLVGKHTYYVTEYENGKRSEIHKIF